MVQRGRGCNVCVFTLCRYILAEFVRPSLMLVGNIKVVEDEVIWRRSKGVVMNSFYVSQFRRCHAGSPIYSGW